MRAKNELKKKKGSKVVHKKVEYDKALMTGLIKVGNLQIKPHCDFERTRDNENKLRKHTQQSVIPEGFDIDSEHQSEEIAIWHHQRLEHPTKSQGGPASIQYHHI